MNWEGVFKELLLKKREKNGRGIFKRFLIIKNSILIVKTKGGRTIHGKGTDYSQKEGDRSLKYSAPHPLKGNP